MMTVFFFSSRRRHTRLQGDWSSDVCSSDLIDLGSLSSDGRDNGRVSVPVEVDPPGGNPVDQTAALVGVEVYPFGLCDADRRRVERLLRERMPDSQFGVHPRNISRSKFLRNTARRPLRCTRFNCGTIPMTSIFPKRSMALRFSRFGL